MIYTIKLNIKQVIEHNATREDKLDLVNYIMQELLTKEDRRKFINGLLSDLIETESEFEKRVDVLGKLNTIMKVLQ